MKPFYTLEATLNDGSKISMGKFRGKKLMLVNTASECGFTPQYEVLQELYEHFCASGFEVIAFPSSDFGGQEPGNNEEIREFCSRNYDVAFTLMEKSRVLGEDTNEVFGWLADKRENGVMDAVPEWNFAKFLVDERGQLIRQVAASESPASDDIIQWLSNEQV